MAKNSGLSPEKDNAWTYQGGGRVGRKMEKEVWCRTGLSTSELTSQIPNVLGGGARTGGRTRTVKHMTKAVVEKSDALAGSRGRVKGS